MNYFNAYAATSAKGQLKPFSFDPGELGPEEVEITVSHCGLCHSKEDGALKKISGSLDLIISTINAGIDVPALLDTLAPNGCLHNVGAVLNPLQVPAFSLISGQKSVAGSPVGSPTAIDDMLDFSARHSVAPITETFPMSKVNDAIEHLRAGKARYRIVLANDLA
jgi:alcohol/geraniol dehydrogenase (NADP+)